MPSFHRGHEAGEVLYLVSGRTETLNGPVLTADAEFSLPKPDTLRETLILLCLVFVCF